MIKWILSAHICRDHTDSKMNFEEKQLASYNKRNAAVNASMDKLEAALADPNADHALAYKTQQREEINAHLVFEAEMSRIDHEYSVVG